MKRQQVVVMADMLVAGPLDQIDMTQIEYDFRAFMREKYGKCAPTCRVVFGLFTTESEDDDV